MSYKNMFEGLFGIEKENIRINQDARISKKAHDNIFGENNPYIIRDFSESQIEMKTSPHKSVLDAYNELHNINHIVISTLKDELLWPQSNPPIIKSEDEILVVTEKGYGKRTLASEYRVQRRGGSGVKTINITDKNGKPKALRVVSVDDDIIVVTNRGIVIRMKIEQISKTGRATQGVRVINLRKDQEVSTVAIVPKDDEEIIVKESENIQVEQLDLENDSNEVKEIQAVETKEKEVKTEKLFEEE